jgi:hypothetical protein
MPKFNPVRSGVLACMGVCVLALATFPSRQRPPNGLIEFYPLSAAPAVGKDLEGLSDAAPCLHQWTYAKAAPAARARLDSSAARVWRTPSA